MNYKYIYIYIYIHTYIYSLDARREGQAMPREVRAAAAPAAVVPLAYNVI